MGEAENTAGNIDFGAVGEMAGDGSLPNGNGSRSSGGAPSSGSGGIAAPAMANTTAFGFGALTGFVTGVLVCRWMGW